MQHSTASASGAVRFFTITVFLLVLGCSIPLVVVLPFMRAHDIWQMSLAGQPVLLGPDLTWLVVCAIGLYYLFYGAIIRTLWAAQIWFRPLMLYGGIATLVLTITAHACYLAAGAGNHAAVLFTALIGLLVWRLTVATAVAFAPHVFGLHDPAVDESARTVAMPLVGALVLAALALAGLWVSHAHAIKRPVQVLPQAPDAVLAGATVASTSAQVGTASAVQSASAPAAPVQRDFAAEAVQDLVFANPAPQNVSAELTAQQVGQHPGTAATTPPFELTMRELLGKNFDEFQDNIAIASEVSRVGDEVFGSGMAPHSGGEQGAAFGIAGSRLYAVVVDKSQMPQITIYGASRLEDLPPQLLRFISEARQ